MSLPASPRTVVTGAASGFGRALALEVAKRGAHLLLGDVNLEGCEETAKKSLAAGAKSARAMRCDVTKVADIEALAAACTEGVDLVVNNAGVATAGAVGDLSLEDWRWTLDVDLWGVIYGCHVFVPLLKKQGHGRILNVASAAGLLSAPNMGAYNVSKAGVVALSETLAAELVATKVTVTALCPTFFQTNIATNGRFADPKSRASAEKLVRNGKRAEDIARAALAAVEHGQLYCVPMADGRWFWRLKRSAPGVFAKLTGMLGKRVMEQGA